MARTQDSMTRTGAPVLQGRAPAGATCTGAGPPGSRRCAPGGARAPLVGWGRDQGGVEAQLVGAVAGQGVLGSGQALVVALTQEVAQRPLDDTTGMLDDRLGVEVLTPAGLLSHERQAPRRGRRSAEPPARR